MNILLEKDEDYFYLIYHSSQKKQLNQNKTLMIGNQQKLYLSNFSHVILQYMDVLLNKS
ncbi:unnamed protein product [Paramecium pentaurelia]|uniref:Uncharacterized protein n=1 Tax=Paramecium pentaurelia TaxID=43138 RepID=A0A8S1T9C3_9CILI|nr:unnamed protein product [Paramecium pentaurelia]CAD8148237.1 unnamed protein product [Paramecium pentaurelia]